MKTKIIYSFPEFLVLLSRKVQIYDENLKPITAVEIANTKFAQVHKNMCEGKYRIEDRG